MESLNNYVMQEVLSWITYPVDVANIRSVCSTWRSAVSPPMVADKTISALIEGSVDEMLQYACDEEVTELVKYALKRWEAMPGDINKGITLVDALACACLSGNLKIVELILAHDPYDLSESMSAVRHSILRGDPSDEARAAHYVDVMGLLVRHNAMVLDEDIAVLCTQRRFDIVQDAIERSPAECTDYSTMRRTRIIVRDFAVGAERMTAPYELGVIFEHACKAHNLDIIKYIRERFYYEKNVLFHWACCEGFTECYNLISDEIYSEDLEEGLTTACENGRAEITKLLIRRMHGEIPDFMLIAACHSGDVETVKAILPYHPVNEYATGITTAASVGALDIVELLVTHGADGLNTAFNEACAEGHIEVVIYLLGRGITDYNDGLFFGCRGGHLAIMQMMVEHGATDLQEPFLFACEYGKAATVEFFRDLKVNHNEGFARACAAENQDTMKALLGRATRCSCGMRLGSHFSSK